MIVFWQRSLPLSVHDESVTNFTNTDIQTRALSHSCKRLVADSQTQLVSIDARLLESRITTTTVRIDTIDAHSAQSACAYTAIVNYAALVYGEILIDSTAKSITVKFF